MVEFTSVLFIEQVDYPDVGGSRNQRSAGASPALYNHAHLDRRMDKDQVLYATKFLLNATLVSTANVSD